MPTLDDLLNELSPEDRKEVEERTIELIAEELNPEPIHKFFGLSYASYIVCPRVLLQSMPRKWQAKFVVLLNEMAQHFESLPHDLAYKVQLMDENDQPIPDPLEDYDRGRRIFPAKAPKRSHSIE